jgi:hypothetical protein
LLLQAQDMAVVGELDAQEQQALVRAGVRLSLVVTKHAAKHAANDHVVIKPTPASRMGYALVLSKEGCRQAHWCSTGRLRGCCCVQLSDMLAEQLDTSMPAPHSECGYTGA